MHLLRGILIAGFILGACWDAGALTPGGGVSSPAAGAGAKKEQEMKKSPPVSVDRVQRVTMLVDRIEGGVLYTQTGQYLLEGVKVRDLTRNSKTGAPARIHMKIAEMTFVNEKLKEVVIRER